MRSEVRAEAFAKKKGLTDALCRLITRLSFFFFEKFSAEKKYCQHPSVSFVGRGEVTQIT